MSMTPESSPGGPRTPESSPGASRRPESSPGAPMRPESSLGAIFGRVPCSPPASWNACFYTPHVQFLEGPDVWFSFRNQLERLILQTLCSIFRGSRCLVSSRNQLERLILQTLCSIFRGSRCLVSSRNQLERKDDFFVQRRPHISVFVHYVVNLTSYQNTGNAQHTVRIAGDPMGNHAPR